VLTSPSRFTLACYCLSEFVADAWKRGVIGRALIYKNETNIDEITLKIWKYPSAEIRYILKNPKSVVSIYDKKEAYIFTNPEVGFKDSPTLWTNNSSLVNIASQYFECVWVKFLKKILEFIKNTLLKNELFVTTIVDIFSVNWKLRIFVIHVNKHYG